MREFPSSSSLRTCWKCIYLEERESLLEEDRRLRVSRRKEGRTLEEREGAEGRRTLSPLSSSFPPRGNIFLSSLLYSRIPTSYTTTNLGSFPL